MFQSIFAALIMIIIIRLHFNQPFNGDEEGSTGCSYIKEKINSNIIKEMFSG